MAADDMLVINKLCAGYRTKACDVMAVDQVDLTLKKGEFLGIAGESGCGKTTLAYTVMNLLEDNAAVFSGSIDFLGKDLLSRTSNQMSQVRWKQIAMVFQSAMNSLNPVIRIEDQLIDAMLAHDRHGTTAEARRRAGEVLKLVDISPDRMKAYPHQLSGGMKQRVMIAMALMLEPDLVIMDEPTTALDVVVQRGIIEKISDLQKTLGFSVIFITHDLSLLVEICDTLAVMYAGQIVETGPARQVFTHSKHPYTQRLMNCFPPLTGDIENFKGIAGKPPDFFNLPEGCRFYPRCDQGMDICKAGIPQLSCDATGHGARCFLNGNIAS